MRLAGWAEEKVCVWVGQQRPLAFPNDPLPKKHHHARIQRNPDNPTTPSIQHIKAVLRDLKDIGPVELRALAALTEAQAGQALEVCRCSCICICILYVCMYEYVHSYTIDRSLPPIHQSIP